MTLKERVVLLLKDNPHAFAKTHIAKLLKLDVYKLMPVLNELVSEPGSGVLSDELFANRRVYYHEGNVSPDGRLPDTLKVKNRPWKRVSESLRVPDKDSYAQDLDLLKESVYDLLTKNNFAFTREDISDILRVSSVRAVSEALKAINETHVGEFDTLNSRLKRKKSKSVMHHYFKGHASNRAPRPYRSDDFISLSMKTRKAVKEKRFERS